VISDAPDTVFRRTRENSSLATTRTCYLPHNSTVMLGTLAGGAPRPDRVGEAPIAGGLATCSGAVSHHKLAWGASSSMSEEPILRMHDIATTCREN